MTGSGVPETEIARSAQIFSTITALEEAVDAHPVLLVTIKAYVPAASPVNVPVDPVPLMVVKPRLSMIVQVPVDGNPLRATLPVVVVQVG